MKLNSKQVELEYRPGEEIFTFPEDTGLPFIFDVLEEELTENKEAMDIVGQMLDEAEFLTEKAKETLKQILSDGNHQKYGMVSYFLEFHRDEVGQETAEALFPGKELSTLSLMDMVDDLQLKRFGCCIDEETHQQVFILDFSFNPELTDELLVIYFDLEKEVVEITHES